MDFYGIRGPPLNWFKRYLTNRKQYVSCNNSTSLPRDITYGVSQGSILGPHLFILYTNDLPLCINKSKSILFADDTNVYMSGKLINDLYKNMNKELEVLADWFHANKLSLNVSKTKYMLFSRSHPVQREETVLTMSDTII